MQPTSSCGSLGSTRTRPCRGWPRKLLTIISPSMDYRRSPDRRAARHGVERSGRQGFQERPLLGEMLGNDAAGGGVHAAVGHLVEPLPKLGVEVVEVAEGTGEEEVLAHVAERPLHLALGLGPVGPARLGQDAV